MAHNLNFHILDCHTLQLSRQKKANSVIVENNPLEEQKNLRKAWFKYRLINGLLCILIKIITAVRAFA